MTDLFDVTGKIALVTGSTGALGNALARGLAEHGARVILNGRNEEKLREKVKELVGEGFRAHGYAFDVTSSKEVGEAVSVIEEEAGLVDILVNNAGIQIRAPLEDFKDEDWDRIMSVNLTGAYLMAKAVVKSMIKRRSGKIINIGSVNNEAGRSTIAPYTASKGGLKNLTKGMAIDWAKYNIQVNGIGPGYFKTEMTRALWENQEFDAWLCNRTPSHRWGNPGELMGALLFLASDASSYVNGHTIYVDGGMLATV